MATGKLQSQFSCPVSARIVCVALVVLLMLILQLFFNMCPAVFPTALQLVNNQKRREISPSLLHSADAGKISSTLNSSSADKKSFPTRHNLSDVDLLALASLAATRETCTDRGRIAFLFITRGDMPLESLWQRYFEGHSKLYSIYVHAKPGYKFPKSSFFYGKEIPSKSIVRKLSMDLVDALRTLTAYALLDDAVCNSWFLLACESTIPIRSFLFTYEYLTNSKISFVDSFHPAPAWVLDSWNMEPDISREQIRKGELWMAFQRKHAGMIVGEMNLYRKFLIDCKYACFPDEEYIQTFLSMYDPQGIANRTIMAVNWTHPHSSSPYTYHSNVINPELIQHLQNLTVDFIGMHQDITGGAGVQSSRCLYNGRFDDQSPCYLFARKFASEDVDALMKLPSSVLGY